MTCPEAAADAPTLVAVAFLLGICFQTAYRYTKAGLRDWSPPWDRPP